MTEQQIRFDDGAAYEQMMGVWSRSAGEIFLDWLATPSSLKWIDVGCGSGAFTQLLVDRCSPLEVQGIDPSEDQLAFDDFWTINRKSPAIASTLPSMASRHPEHIRPGKHHARHAGKDEAGINEILDCRPCCIDP
jgi:SAM-dependent methyltransferase